jgi:MFS family permease
MLIQPVLPLFAVDELGISNVEMAAAISVARGLGFVVSSPLWGRWIEEVPLLRLTSFVFLGFGLFPLLLSLAPSSLVWLYVAYFWYGIAQGGSHLVWNMSGPIFAGKEGSARYTGVNVVMAGLRGGVAPPLGGVLGSVWGSVEVLIAGALLCVTSGLYMLKSRFVEKKNFS